MEDGYERIGILGVIPRDSFLDVKKMVNDRLFKECFGDLSEEDQRKIKMSLALIERQIEAMAGHVIFDRKW